jgi:hypothetical protein
MVISVTNDSFDIFSYPGFLVFDEDMNQVGQEEVMFFGIGSESVHFVEHTLENIQTGELYPLNMELWTGFYEELACTFGGEAILIPDQCADINFWFNAGGGQSFEEDFSYNILDLEGLVVQSGVIPVSSDSLYHAFSFCLDPGCYTLQISTFDAVISNDLYFGVYHLMSNEDNGGVASAGSVMEEFEFSVYDNCIVTDVPKKELDHVVIYPNPTLGNDVFLVGLGLDEIQVYAPDGRLLVTKNVNGDTSLDIEALPSGLYIIRSTNQLFKETRLVVQR